MRPDVYWIDAATGLRLAIMPRPRAGDWLEDEIAGWRLEGVDVVVSLLEPDEAAELGLQREAALCTAQGMRFLALPIPDRGVPESPAELRRLAAELAERLVQGEAVAIHCRAGIGRSSLIAACVLACRGYDAEAAFALLAQARGVAVPDTDAQRNWVAAFRGQH